MREKTVILLKVPTHLLHALSGGGKWAGGSPDDFGVDRSEITSATTNTFAAARPSEAIRVATRFCSHWSGSAAALGSVCNRIQSRGPGAGLAVDGFNRRQQIFTPRSSQLPGPQLQGPVRAVEQPRIPVEACLKATEYSVHTSTFPLAGLPAHRGILSRC